MKLKGYKLFTLESPSILYARSYVYVGNSRRYEIRRKGFFNKRYEFHRKGKVKMELEIYRYFFKKEVGIFQFGHLKAAFSQSAFSNSFSIDSHYGRYHIVKDSLLSSSYTISNSTTEVVKISSKGLMKKKYGVAIHSNEHIEFLLCLSFYIVYRMIKKKGK